MNFSLDKVQNHKSDFALLFHTYVQELSAYEEKISNDVIENQISMYCSDKAKQILT